MDGSPPSTEADRLLKIDVFSDVVCPWCFIGKRKLEAALGARPEASFDMRWRAYQLDPTIPPEGVDRHAYLEKKFGGSEKVGQIYERIRAAGAEVGIAFAFEKIKRSPNTLDAHRLILWSYAAGVQPQVKEDLMWRYFVEGEDIGYRGVLVDVAASNGMQAELVQRLLEEGADAVLVRDEAERAREAGITGVPFFVFGGQFAVPGAQSPEILAAAIEKARRDTPLAAA